MLTELLQRRLRKQVGVGGDGGGDGSRAARGTAQHTPRCATWPVALVVGDERGAGPEGTGVGPRGRWRTFACPQVLAWKLYTVC